MNMSETTFRAQVGILTQVAKGSRWFVTDAVQGAASYMLHILNSHKLSAEAAQRTIDANLKDIKSLQATQRALETKNNALMENATKLQAHVNQISKQLAQLNTEKSKLATTLDNLNNVYERKLNQELECYKKTLQENELKLKNELQAHQITKQQKEALIQRVEVANRELAAFAKLRQETVAHLFEQTDKAEALVNNLHEVLHAIGVEAQLLKDSSCIG